MSETSTDRLPEMKLREFCQRIGVSYRDARYALDRGVVPRGIEAEPGRGNHRRFDARQAFHLGLVVKLKAAGVHTPVAAEIARWAMKAQGMAVNLGWDWAFAPFTGQYRTDKRWVLEVADGRCVRIGTDANPSRAGMDFTPWTDMSARKTAKVVAPVVVIRIDLSALAARLA